MLLANQNTNITQVKYQIIFPLMWEILFFSNKQWYFEWILGSISLERHSNSHFLVVKMNYISMPTVKFVISHIRYYIVFQLVMMMSTIVFAQESYDNILLIIGKTATEIRHDSNSVKQMLYAHQKSLDKYLKGDELLKLGVLKNGGALYQTNTATFDLLNNELQSDPLFTNHYFLLEAMSYLNKRGNVCRYSDNCSKQSFQLIFFWPNMNKETVRIASEMEYQHQLFLNQHFTESDILLAGKFQERDGNFIITGKEETSNLLNSNPAIAQDYFIRETIHFAGCSDLNCVQNK